jgi:hypothetical protein
MFSRGNLPTLVSTSSTGSDGESLLVVTEEDVVLEDETVSPLRQRAHSRSRSGSVKFKKAVF